MSPFGGDERDRTDDPLLAKQVLSQLSYTPISDFGYQISDFRPFGLFLFQYPDLLTILFSFLGAGLEPQKLNND